MQKYIKKYVFFVLIFAVLLMNSGFALSSNLNNNINNININRVILKIRVPFDSANSLVGTAGAGFIDSSNKSYKLSSMTKYKINFNPKGSYDLFVIQNNNQVKLAELEADFILSSLDNSPVFINNTWYRGKIKISKTSTGIIAVNYIGLEDFLVSVLSTLSSSDSYTEAIKASAVIMRSSLLCLDFDRESKKRDYQLSSAEIDYQGLKAEKSTVSQQIKKTEGEVLLDKYGKLACSSFRSASVVGAFPFELIGFKTNAWEKTFTFDIIHEILQEEGYFTLVNIYSVERRVIPKESKIMLVVNTSEGEIELTQKQAQDLFGLPSQFFRVYSFRDSLGKTRIQFLGGLAGFTDKIKHESVLNIVDSLEKSIAFPDQQYDSIIYDMYPESYLARI